MGASWPYSDIENGTTYIFYDLSSPALKWSRKKLYIFRRFTSEMSVIDIWVLILTRKYAA